MPDLIFYILGIALVLAIFWDAFITILSMRSGGPITNLWTGAAWKSLLWAHRRRPMHSVLSLAGPGFTVIAIVIWYLGLSVGWFLIFSAHPEAVVHDGTRNTATFLERLYYTGATLSAVGYGDFLPSGFPWTILANSGAFMGTFLLTTSLSYLMPVVSAALERKQLARSIFIVGETPQDIIRNSWTEGNSSALNTHWMTVSTELSRFAQKHLTYPVLRFFHSRHAERSPVIAVLCLSDAFFLMRCARPYDDRPPDGLLETGHRAIDGFANLITQQSNIADADPLSASHLSPQTLKDLGIEPIDDADFQQKLNEYKDLRSRLIELCAEDGWAADFDNPREATN